MLVEVDGRLVRADYDADSGRLTATLRLPPGRHEVWIGAYNHAYAPRQAILTLTVRR